MQRVLRVSRILVQIALIGATSLSEAQAARAPVPLIISTQAQTSSTARGMISTQGVQLNDAALDAPVISIALEGAELTFNRTRIVRSDSGTTTWVGQLADGRSGQVVVTRHAGQHAGMIQIEDRRYRIQTGSAGGDTLQALESPLYAEDAGAVSVPDSALPPAQSGGGAPPADGTSAESLAETSPNPTGPSAALAETALVTQTLLAVYTESACTLAGSCLQVEAEIINKVALTNTVYANSGVHINLELVGMQQVNYAGQESEAALDALRRTNDGVMDEVHTLRDQINADLVALIVDLDQPAFGVCGIAYLSASATFAFSVTDFEDAVCSEYTFTHELGHNQGAQHDRVTTLNGGDAIGPDEFSFGYRRCNDGSFDDVGAPFFRTVMAYSCTGADRIPNFSNPNVLSAGVPTGIDPAADATRAAFAARTLSESALTVAAFRDGPAPPATPGNLQVTVDASPQAQLTWADNSSTETSFLVYRYDFVTLEWLVIATLPADSTSYIDDTVLNGRDYSFAIVASSSAGNSGFSNQVVVSIPVTLDEVEPNNSAGQANPIAIGETLLHALNPADDEDWLTFTLTRTSSVTATTSGASGDTRLWLYDDALNELAFDDDGGAGLFSSITVTCDGTPLPAGTYYLRVNEFSGGVLDEFSISLTGAFCPDEIEPNNSAGEANPIAIGETLLHALNPAGDEDWLTFTLTEISGVTATTSGVSGDTRLWLYDAALTEIAFNDDDGDSLFSSITVSCDVDPLPPGTYYLKVDEFSGNVLAEFFISLSSSRCNDVDSDGDGLSDALELTLGTNPLRADTDGDGLVDFFEVNLDGNPSTFTPGVDTDPTFYDSDLDGIGDGKEVELGTSPIAASSDVEFANAFWDLAGGAVRKVAIMPLPLLGGLIALVGWLAVRRASGRR